LFFLRLRPGQDRMAYVPSRHRDIVQDTIDVCHFRSHLADPPAHPHLPARSQLNVETRPGDNVAVLTVTWAGDDLTARIEGSACACSHEVSTRSTWTFHSIGPSRPT
jgi:hypothetical protein